MTRRRIRALVVKDLRLHWKGIVGVHAGAVVLCLSALALGGPRDTGILGAFVANMNVISLLLWGEWFISREKTKGTFAWLGTLPISAFELGASKFFVAGGCIVSLWTLTSLAFLRSQFFPDAWTAWLVILLTLLLAGAIVIASRWLVRGKPGQMLPFAAFLVLTFAFMVGRRSGVLDGILAIWATASGRLFVAVLVATAYGGVCWMTIRIVASRETRYFVE